MNCIVLSFMKMREREVIVLKHLFVKIVKFCHHYTCTFFLSNSEIIYLLIRFIPVLKSIFPHDFYCLQSSVCCFPLILDLVVSISET